MRTSTTPVPLQNRTVPLPLRARPQCRRQEHRSSRRHEDAQAGASARLAVNFAALLCAMHAVVRGSGHLTHLRRSCAHRAVSGRCTQPQSGNALRCGRISKSTCAECGRCASTATRRRRTDRPLMAADVHAPSCSRSCSAMPSYCGSDSRRANKGRQTARLRRCGEQRAAQALRADLGGLALLLSQQSAQFCFERGSRATHGRGWQAGTSGSGPAPGMLDLPLFGSRSAK